jgi:exosortase
MRAVVAGRPRVELVAAALAVALLALYLPVLRALVMVWTDVPYYSYGFLVPIFSAFLVHDAREEVARRPLAPSRSGMVVLGAGLGLLVIGLGLDSLSVQTLSLPLSLAGALVLIFGAPRTRALAFPLGFLVLMAPLPDGVLPALSLPLQHAAAIAGEWLLWLVGVPVVREDLYVTVPNVRLHITEACNGLRFLLAMIVIGVAFAGTTQKGWRRRVIVVAAALVAALLANWLRVAGTGLMAQLYGHQAAEGFYHVAWGKLIYAAMLVPFAMLVMALRRQS